MCDACSPRARSAGLRAAATGPLVDPMVIALLSGAIRAIERLERRPDELRLLLQRSLESNHHFLGRRKYGHHAARDEFAGGHQQRLDGDLRCEVPRLR